MSPRLPACLLLIAALFTSGCSTAPVNARMDEANGEAAGTVIIMLDRGIPGISVSIDDKTVTEGVRTQLITIENVPPGERRVRVMAGGPLLEEDLAYDEVHAVEAGNRTVIGITTPLEDQVFREVLILLPLIFLTVP